MCREASTTQPAGVDIARIGALAGRRAVGFRRAIRGYTPAERWIVALADGSSAFAKIAVDPLTADGLRTEQRVYAPLQGGFMPQVRGWDDGERPLLLLEDLSGCRWPPPWDATSVDRVLAALASLRAADLGDALPPLSVADRDLGGSWRRVAAAPAEFLSLGLASPRWLRGYWRDLLAQAKDVREAMIRDGLVVPGEGLHKLQTSIGKPKGKSWLEIVVDISEEALIDLHGIDLFEQ